MKLTRGECVCGGMRRIASWIAWTAVIMLTAVASAQGVSTTTVQGTVYLANGQPGGGTLVLSWPAFTTAAGQAIAADQLTVTIPSDGFVSVNLAPNQGATPAGEYYTAVYYMSDGSSSTDYWVVPAAASATPAQVQAQVMPAAQAVQAVSKAYVDQSITELQESLLSASGGDLTGPLYLNGDPTQPLQAADKHYVDTQVATAVPLSGGSMTGALMLSADPTQALQAADKEYVDASATNGWPVLVLRADEYTGTDFGAKLQACVNAVSTSYGGTCDARNFSGSQTMSASVTISTANTTVLLPCAAISTANQIVVTAGTRNVALRGCALRGGSAASGTQGGTDMSYTGVGALIQVGDPTYAVDTTGFHLDNVVINTTPATSALARGLVAYRTQELDIESVYLMGNANQTGMTLDGTGNYTGGTFLDDQLDGFQMAVNAIGHQVTNTATTDWMNASSFVRLHIDCPTSSGAPIAGTYGINLQQGDGNTFTGGDVEGCATALHLGANAQNNTIVGLRNGNSTKQVVADAGSSYNSWMTGGTMLAGQLTDNGMRNSFLDSFHRSFNGLTGDWYGSQQDATLTNNFRLGIGSGNERGLLNRYQTDYGYRWTTGLSDATAGEQFYEVLDDLNNVSRLSVGQYNSGQSSTNNQTAINSAGTGAVVLNGQNNAGTGGVVFGSGGASAATVATIGNTGNAQFAGAMTVRNNADAEVDYNLWPGLTTSQQGSFTYKDWNGNNQWSMVKDVSNNWSLNSAVGGLDSFKAYQSTNSGDTYVNASNASGTVRVNYETGSGTAFNVYGGNAGTLYASFTGTTAIEFPGLAASSGHSCLQVDTSGYVTNTGSACGSGSGGSGTVNSSNTGYIAYYTATGTAVGGESSVPVTAGGTGATTAAAALSNLGALPISGGTLTGALHGTTGSFSGAVTATGGFTGSLTGAASLNLPLAGGTMTGALAFSSSTVSKASWTNISAGLGCTSATPLWSFYANACVANAGGGGYSGVSSNGAGGLTASGSYAGTTVEGSGPPVIDLRNPAYGAVCDNATDIGPALQAALNAYAPPTYSGVVIQIVGNPVACYLANPTTLAWPSGLHVELQIQGTLRVGTTLATNADLIGTGAGLTTSFEAGNHAASITMNTLTGTLGTAVTVSNMPSAGTTATFTPSTMTGLYPGAAITVAGTTTCALTNPTLLNNVVTATVPSGCHIPPGVPLTIAGVANSSFNGTFTGQGGGTGSSMNFLSTASDYVQNTISWLQYGTNASSAGGTITGLNEDTVENVIIAATTGTTATATFFRAHTAADTWGVDTVFAMDPTSPSGTPIPNPAKSELQNVLIVSGGGTALWLQGYLARLDNVSTQSTAACSGDVAAFTADAGSSSLVLIKNSVFNAACQPWALRIDEQYTQTGQQGGGIYIDNSVFSGGGIKMDHGGAVVDVNHSTFEEAARGAITMDPANFWSGSAQKITIENSLLQDNPDGFIQCWVNFLTPAQVPVRERNLEEPGSCDANDYVMGHLDTDDYGRDDLNTARGTIGVRNDGKTLEAELRGEGANFSPSIIPYATISMFAQSSWQTNCNGCTVTTGIPAPDSSNTAVSLTASNQGLDEVGQWIGTPAVGDIVLYGGWVYTPTHGTQALAGSNGSAFAVGANNGGHFYLSPDGTAVDQSQGVNSNNCDSGIFDDWWHPVVCWAVVTTSDGTGSQQVGMYMNASSTKTMEYFNPWMMYIPATANIPLAEMMRWRQQLMHSFVPSGATAGTLAVDPNLSLTATTAAALTGAPTTGQYWGSNGTAQGWYTPMVYPGAGIANSTGTGWGTSYAVGTSPGDLVQLDSNAVLPAVSGANLTALPSIALTPTTVTAAGIITGANDSVRTTSTTIATTSFTTTGLVLPSVPASTTKSGRCTIDWQMSSTSYTATFGLGMNNAPTDVWGGSSVTYAAAGTSNWLAFTQTSTAATAVSTAATAGATGTTYRAEIDFTLKTGATNPVTMTFYGETSSTSGTLTIEPGSVCYWLP